jgi:hypothetical protein
MKNRVLQPQRDDHPTVPTYPLHMSSSEERLDESYADVTDSRDDGPSRWVTRTAR